MNATGILIILLMGIVMGIRGFIDFLNLKHSGHHPPRHQECVFEPEQYRLSRQYLKSNIVLTRVMEICQLFAILVFWLGKGFFHLDQWVRGLGYGPVMAGLIYVGVLAVLCMVFSIPFDLFRTFGLEERFGFNRTGWRTFLMDKIKGIVLTAILGVPVMSAILSFFHYFGSEAWWICWIFSVSFIFLVHYLSPALLMPLFNTFTPLQPGNLRESILALSESVEFPIGSIFIMDGSKRSNKSNAFFIGFGQNKRVVFYDTLLERHTDRELISILAHEVGHHKKRHPHQTMAISALYAGVMFYLLSLCISKPSLYEAFYVPEMSIHTGLVFFGILSVPVETLLNVIIYAISRKNELEADRFSAEITGDPDSLISALRKLSRENLCNLHPHPSYVYLHHSHPPLITRIENIRKSVRYNRPIADSKA
jgi:STE24 endopeptidase